MKKIIIAFTAGQTLQIVILVVGMAITYTANLLIFCATAGIDMPVVIHRRNNCEWVVIQPLEDWIALYGAWEIERWEAEQD